MMRPFDAKRGLRLLNAKRNIGTYIKYGTFIVSLLLFSATVIFLTRSEFVSRHEFQIINAKVGNFTLNVDINLHTDGGEASTYVVHGRKKQPIGALPEPVKLGYVFTGWYSTPTFEDGTGVNEQTIVTRNITDLYANYRKDKFELEIDLNGGVADCESTYQIEYQDTFLLPTPTKLGYTFVGWEVVTGDETTISETLDENNNKVYTVEMGYSNLIVKAKWTINTYTLTLVKNNGEDNQTMQIDYNTPVSLTNPNKIGHTFIGWTNIEKLVGQRMPAEDVELSANYVANTYKWLVNHNIMNGDGTAYNFYEAETGEGDYGTLFKGTLKDYTGFINPPQTQKTIDVDKTPNEEGYATNNILDYDYARKRNSLTISPNGGTYQGNNEAVILSDVYYQEQITLDTTTRIGYTFDNWTIDGSLATVDTNVVTMGDASAIVTANWIARTYTLTFNVNGGDTLAKDDKIVTYDQTYGDLPTPNRTGYTFNGWFTETTGGSKITADTEVKITDNQILYAQWSANTYEVVLDQHGGSGGTSSVVATYDAPMPSANPSTKTGYTFGGYYAQENGEGTRYYETSTPMVSKHVWDQTNDATIHAKWTANTYEVTLDQQGGSGGTSSVVATYDNAMPADKVAPNKTGFTFGGYYTKSAGGGNQYYNSIMESLRNWDIANDTKLYAFWTVNSYTVILDPQGGSGGTTSVMAAYDAPMPSASAPTLFGNSFRGFYTEKNGEGTQYYNSLMESANNWNLTSQTTLYAKWTACIAGQYLNGNECSVCPKDTYSEGTANETYSACPEGYTTEGTGSNTKTACKITCPANTHVDTIDSSCVACPTGYSSEEHTVEAGTTSTCTPNTYTITLDKQSGSGGSDQVTATYDAPMPSATAPTRTGYSFGGYFNQTNGNGTQYYTRSMLSAKPWDIISDTILYAKWNACEAGTYLSDNSCEECEKDTYSEGTANETCSACPEGYTTVGTGSNTKTACKITCSANTHVETIDTSCVACPIGYSSEEHTVEAGTTSTCTPNNYTVTLNSQNGSGGTSSVTATYDAPMPSATAPTYTGHSFDGYYSEAEGNGTMYYNSSMLSAKAWDIASDTPLYAKWSACGAGKYLNDNTCSSCEIGTYSTGSANATCSACPSGYTTNSIGSNLKTACKITCSAGTHVEEADKGCVACPVGYTTEEHSVDSGSTSTCSVIKNTITFDKQGGSGGSDEVIATYGEDMPSATAPTYSGYSFGGYYTQTNGEGTKYYTSTMASEKAWDKTSNTKLYAKWSACGAGTYLNGNECSECPKDTYSEGTANASCSACPSGYTTEGTGSNTKTACKITCSANTQITSVDAQCSSCPTGYESSGGTYSSGQTSVCSPKTYAVTFYKQGGSGGSDNVTATYDAPMPSATAPTYSGYSFGGYYTQTNGNGTQYYTGSMLSAKAWDIASDTPLYAKWSACGAGTYLNGNTCSVCPKDTYSTGSANASCSACPTGYSTSGTGSTTKSACKITCSANQYVASADAQCSSCPTGYESSGETVSAGSTSSCSPINYSVTLSKSYTSTTNTSGTAISSIGVPYNGTSQIKVAPNSGYYLSGASCTTGYSTNASTGKSYTSTQTVTITNKNGSSGYAGTGTCTFTGCSTSNGSSCCTSSNGCQTNGTINCAGTCAGQTACSSNKGTSCCGSSYGCSSNGTYNCAGTCTGYSACNANNGKACCAYAACSTNGKYNCAGSCIGSVAKSYTLTVSKGSYIKSTSTKVGSNTASTSTSFSVPCGTSVTVTATPNDKTGPAWTNTNAASASNVNSYRYYRTTTYSVNSFTASGVTGTKSGNSYTFTMPASNVTITANGTYSNSDSQTQRSTYHAATTSPRSSVGYKFNKVDASTGATGSGYPYTGTISKGGTAYAGSSGKVVITFDGYTLNVKRTDTSSVFTTYKATITLTCTTTNTSNSTTVAKNGTTFNLSVTGLGTTNAAYYSWDKV